MASVASIAFFAVQAITQIMACPALAATARIAVATNFRDAAEEIGAAFRAATAHELEFSFGSTGQLFVQISRGAPFDAFLAADQDRAQRAVEDGMGVRGSRFTYATGRIVLFSIDDRLVTGPETLQRGQFENLAIAEPASAPYGVAAVESMQALGCFQALRNRIVKGLNVAQAYQFVFSGNAALGFVALAQVVHHSHGSRWLVPQSLHRPIAQDAVLLQKGSENVAAKAFLEFLRGSQAEAVRRRYGYAASN